jgi:predicted nuclease with TOPRIM domain
MQTLEQISKMAIEHSGEIAALKQRITTSEERIKENAALLTGIHQLAANVESLTSEVKRLGDKLDSGLREQGKRIGELETTTIRLSNMENMVNSVYSRVNIIEKEPAEKWKKFVWLIVAGIATALVAYFAGKYL